MTNILLFCGPTGSGKTFISGTLSSVDMAKYVISSKPPVFHKPMQVTTRPIRSTEDPDAYLFINEKDYNALNINEKLTARTHFNDNYYGTLVDNFVHGENVWNIIVASSEGAADVYNMFRNNAEYNIKSAIILSEPDDGMINEHCRDIQFFKDEIFDLMQSPYDYYIPNYMDSRARLVDVLNALGYETKKGI
jgi:hypothetical protein